MVFRPQLVILAGIPGCGKSTWAANMFPHPYRQTVSSDGIREELSHVYDQSRNDEVFEVFHYRIGNYLLHKFDVVADSTALSRSAREKMVFVGNLHDAYIDLVYFSNCDEAIRRNAARERKVPVEAMLRMLDKYERFKTELIQERDWYRSVTEIRSVT